VVFRDKRLIVSFIVQMSTRRCIVWDKTRTGRCVIRNEGFLVRRLFVRNTFFVTFTPGVDEDILISLVI
jgi:hypothetical protein